MFDFVPFRSTPHQNETGNFTLALSSKRRREWQSAATLSAKLGLSNELVLSALERALQEEQNVQKMSSRKRQVCTVFFNINSLSESQTSNDFRFLVPEISTICQSMNWCGATNRNSYV